LLACRRGRGGRSRQLRVRLKMGEVERAIRKRFPFFIGAEDTQLRDKMSRGGQASRACLFEASLGTGGTGGTGGQAGIALFKEARRQIPDL